MKTWDCFSFFNELDLLELRLNELNSVVDVFVLVEMTTTHKGDPKPLYFDQARQEPRFKKFEGKIVHVKVSNAPNNGSYSNEPFQRQQIWRAIQTRAADDVILISDLDEIPRPEIVVRHKGCQTPIGLVHTFYYYFFNLLVGTSGEDCWGGTKIIPGRFLNSPQSIQDIYRAVNMPHVKDAGWHFSYLGGVEKIQTKIKSFMHQELNVPKFTDPNEIARKIAEGKDLFDRDYYKFRKVPIDGSFPAYLLANLKRYGEYTLPV